jgi:hypothetical protein
MGILLNITPTDAAFLCLVIFGGMGITAMLLSAWLKRQTQREMHEFHTALRSPGESGVHPRPRVLPVLPPEPRAVKCAHCVHFDLAAGRAAMEQFPAFVMMTRVRTPAQQYNTEASPNNVPVTAKWSDFGACTAHAEVRFEGDKCAQYEEKAS